MIINSYFFKIRGRKHDQWKGQYAARTTSGESDLPGPTVKSSDFSASPLKNGTILMQKNTAWNLYPVYWPSMYAKFVLYPPAECTVGGTYPRDWKTNVFLRHFLPRDDWEEFYVSKIVNLNKPGRQIK